eukprot:m.121743 g.121743  ORF g.121743 m.121743 type:complete len:395 (-) comp13705_c0_seq1:123-1307(-)
MMEEREPSDMSTDVSQKQMAIVQRGDEDQQLALLTQSATLLCLDVPIGTSFGIDYQSWTTAQNFKGVKLIPPGLHFIYFSSTDRTEAAGLASGPRTGYFKTLSKGDILVMRWSKDTEMLTFEDTDDEQLERIRADLPNLDRFLGAYPYGDTLTTWLSLTNHIRDIDLIRLQPTSGVVSSASELEGVSGVMARRRHDTMETETDEEVAVRAQQREANAEAWRTLEPREGTCFRFTEIPRRLFPPGASPADISKHSMDRSFTLHHILEQLDDTQALLAEVQLSFVSFLLGQVFDGFEQWKQLLNLVCNCDDALLTYTPLYQQLIEIIHFQIKETPQDFFIDIVSSNNFLVHILQELFQRTADMAGEGLDQDFVQQVNGFRQYCTQHYGWTFELEDS